MMANLPPGTILLLGALLIPLLRGRVRQVGMLVLPLASFAHLLWFHRTDMTVQWTQFDYELTPIRIDKLSLVWGYVFHIATFLGVVFALHVKDVVQQVTALIYAGASIGAIFAGDLLTLFVYWEMTAIASVFLIWAGNTKSSYAAGMRYLVLHVGSGVLLLSGALLHLQSGGSLTFGAPGETGMFHDLQSWAARILLLGFGIKAAFPLLHCWLPDAYPESTPTGTVFLSALTTKMAIYALARGFAGCELLITIGAIMAIFPLLYAVLADDMRRTLAHVLNNQLGFMVVAIGIGSPLAINGAAAQAFAHVIYKGLLFMSLGAVLYRTGTARQSELGGLARMMPWTCAFCLIGALSVAPLNCGFVTKALVLKAVAEDHLTVVWLVLMAGAVGAFLTAGIKVPYFTFFGRPARQHVKEAPANMLWAMGLSASLCLLIGAAPKLLYRILPYDLGAYTPYDVAHVVTQLQTLLFTTLGFAMLLRLGYYPQPVPGRLLDIDWLYMRGLPSWLARISRVVRIDRWMTQVELRLAATWTQLTYQCSEAGKLGRSVSTNAMAIAAIILLAVYLLLYYR